MEEEAVRTQRDCGVPEFSYRDAVNQYSLTVIVSHFCCKFEKTDSTWNQIESNYHKFCLVYRKGFV